MIKVALVVLLALTAIKADDAVACWENIGNLENDGEAFIVYEDDAMTLSKCKDYCWNWETGCLSIVQTF